LSGLLAIGDDPDDWGAGDGSGGTPGHCLSDVLGPLRRGHPDRRQSLAIPVPDRQARKKLAIGNYLDVKYWRPRRCLLVSTVLGPRQIAGPMLLIMK
jgi:hypothetical protein